MDYILRYLDILHKYLCIRVRITIPPIAFGCW